jgi:hypothetical protein
MTKRDRCKKPEKHHFKILGLYAISGANPPAGRIYSVRCDKCDRKYIGSFGRYWR